MNGGKEMKKFEYNVIPLSKKGHQNGVTYEVDEKVLNELGQEGWELISLANKQLVFKREINEK